MGRGGRRPPPPDVRGARDNAQCGQRRKRDQGGGSKFLHAVAYAPEARGALEGMRVIDVSRLVARNMASHILADHGAEVIKVEKPGRGDDLREWRVEGVSTYWKVYSRNKKSLALDYECQPGAEILKQLIASADALIENFVPGKLERLGFVPSDLLAINPRLVILRISGWGQTGPSRGKPGFGTTVEAMSGFAAMNGFADRLPTLPPLPLADMVTGLYGANAVLIAFRHAEKTGQGQVIDLSLFDAMVSVLGPMAANCALTGKTAERQGSRAANAAPRNVYACSDGRFIALSASMQSMTERLFRLMDRPDLIDDPRFRTNADRLRNVDALDELVGAFFAERTQDTILALCDGGGVTVAPVLDAADLLNHALVIERESLVVVADEEMRRLPMHNVVARLSATPGVFRSPAPSLGFHNDEILNRLGIEDDGQARLRRQAAIP